jgi:hypothetical protein
VRPTGGNFGRLCGNKAKKCAESWTADWHTPGVQPLLHALLIVLLAVPFASWAAMITLAGRSPDGFEDAGGFHFGLLRNATDGDRFAWFACEI